jgi:hypothetical protein
VSPDGGPFVGNDLASCLYGYGDPSCPYLNTVSTMMGMNVIMTCSMTPQMGPGSGGSGAGGGGGTGGDDGGPKDGGGGG